MESITGDTEDLTEKRKFRLKSLRTRLFGKKRGEEDKEGQLSHSASDITKGEALGSEDDLVCSQGALGLRALSHDSIFMAELSGPETSRVFSQENVHGKIKALQEKLQQQNMRLGPPPLVLPIRRQEDLGGSSEDDGLPHSPPETCPGDTPSHNASSKASSRPLSPIVRPPPADPHPPPAPSVHPAPSPSPSPLVPGVPPADFGIPARFSACLDSSAARHRMSVKPRNQRATAKSRRLTPSKSRPRSESLNSIERPPSKNNQDAAVVKDTMRLRSHSTHILGAGVSTASTAPPRAPLKIPELTPLQSAPLKTQEALRSCSPSSAPPHRPSPRGQTLPAVPDCSNPNPDCSPAPLTSPVPDCSPSPLTSPVPDCSPSPLTSPVPDCSPAPLTSRPPGAQPQKPAEPQPSSALPQPSSALPQPSSALPQPSSALPQPSSALPQPSSALPQPSSALPQPSSALPQPSSALPQPSSALPIPELRNRGEGIGPPEQSARPALPEQSSRPAPPEQSARPALAPHPGPPPAKRDPSLSGVPESTPDPESHKKNPVSSARPSASLSAVVAIKTSSLRRGSQERASQWKATGPPAGQENPVQAEARSTGGMHRVASGSGSFKFSINSARGDQARPREDQAKPRGGSFLALGEQAGAGLRKEEREGVAEAKITMDTGTMAEESREGVEEAMEAKEEEEEEKTAFGVKLRSTSLSLKYRSEATAFGQSDPNVKRYSVEAGLMTPTLAPFDPTSRPLGADRRDNKANLSLKKPPSNISPTAATLSAQAKSDPAQPTPTSLKDVQLTLSPANNAPAPVLEAPSTSLAPRDTQLPQAAAQAEVSWMSLAMEKTRSLQHLFTSRLPREFPGMQQAAPRPQTEPQTQAQTQKQANSQLETQTVTQSQTQDASQSQTVKQLPAEAARAPVSQTTSQPQPAKQPPGPSVIQPQTPVQLKTTTQTTKSTITQTTCQTHTGKLSQTQNITPISNQASSRPVQPTTTQPPVQFSPRFSQVNQQPNLRTTQPLLRSLPQTRGETPSQAPLSLSLSSSPRSLPSQPTWSSQVLQSNPQPKPTTPALAPAPAPALAPAPVPGRGEKASSFQGRGDGASVSERCAARPGAVEERAAAPAGTKVPPHTPAGTKVPPHTPAGTKVPPHTPAGTKVPPHTPAGTKVPPHAPAGTKVPPHAPAGTKVEQRKTPLETPTSTPEGRPESSPTKVPGRLADREDKWLRKNMPSSSSPSSSPTSSSPLQNISNSGQPSWMELAKRKSMAWGDKAMD